MHDKLPFNKLLHIEENKAEVLNVPLSALTCVPKFVNAAFYLRLVLRNIDENKNKSFDKYKSFAREEKFLDSYIHFIRVR